MRLRNSIYLVSGIASEAEWETESSLEDNLGYYRENNFTYVPLPRTGNYWDREEEKKKPISQNQVFKEDDDLIEALETLREEPFLLIDYRGKLSEELDIIDERGLSFEVDGRSYGMWELSEELSDEEFESEFREEYPDYDHFEEGFMETAELRIVTLADVNRRAVLEMIYPIISEIENGLTNSIKSKFQDSRALFDIASPDAIGRYEKAKIEGIGNHIAEFMTLNGLRKTIGQDHSLLEACNLSEGDLGRLRGISDLRNKVMHPNRNLVSSKEDLDELVEDIYLANKLEEKINQRE